MTADNETNCRLMDSENPTFNLVNKKILRPFMEGREIKKDECMVRLASVVLMCNHACQLDDLAGR